MHAGVCIIVRGKVKGVTHRDDGLGCLHGTSTVNSASPVHCPKTTVGEATISQVLRCGRVNERPFDVSLGRQKPE